MFEAVGLCAVGGAALKVHLFGNCQVTALRKIIQEDHPGWSVSAMELGLESSTAPENVANH